MTQGPLTDIQRARILDAMVGVLGEHGFAGTTVGLVCSRAKVSSRTFYETFDGREQCFLALLDEGYRQISALVSDALGRAGCWQDGVRGALVEVLSLLDAEPQMARVWLVESLCAGRWALERREQHFKALSQMIASHWPLPDELSHHSLAAVAAIESVAGILQTCLLSAAEPPPLLGLLGPLTGLVAAPYLDAHAVRAEIDRAEALALALLTQRAAAQPSDALMDPPIEIPAVLRDPRAHRARGCLRYLAEHPGASNRQIADGIGIVRHDQASTLLSRLATIGLLTKRPTSPGCPNAWTLTEHGAAVTHALASAASECSDN